MDARAAVTEGDGAFSVESVDIAAPAAGEVLVEIKASGVCHTDWDSLRWEETAHPGARGSGQGARRRGGRGEFPWMIASCSIGRFRAASVSSASAEKRISARITAQFG